MDTLTYPKRTQAEQRVPAWALVSIIIGTMLLPGMDAIAKSLKGLASVATITLVRNVAQVGLLLPFALYRYGKAAFHIKDWYIQLVRSLCIVLCGMSFFAAVQRMPLADALAISFVHPMIVAAFSPFILGEHLSRRQWAAVGLGFLGSLIIIRPGSGIFGFSAALPLAAALFYAGYGLATRRLATGAVPVILLQLWSGIFSSLLIVPVMVVLVMIAAHTMAISAISFTVPTGQTTLALLAMALFGTTGHLLITRGARHVSATLTAGLGYVEIISATALGWYFFGNFPDFWTWLGLALIIVSSIWLTRIGNTMTVT